MWFLEFLIGVFLIVFFGGGFLALIGMGILMSRVNKHNDWAYKQNEMRARQNKIRAKQNRDD